jgi:tRNA (guanine-N7-)-methyltransferase
VFDGPEHVRSFNARQGRISGGLRQFWADHADGYLMPAGPWDLPPRTMLEIGCGWGDALLAGADRYDLVIGVDVHLRGLAATVRAAHDAQVRSVRLVRGDAIEVLTHQVPDASLEAVHVWFPDPWPKAKHRKRRIIRPAVAALIATALRPGGLLLLATDHDCYAAAMLEVLRAAPGLEPVGEGGIVERPGWRPVTRYEALAQAQDRAVTELAFVRIN